MTKKINNSPLFFFIYFATTAVYVYINTYLPVLFYNVLKVDLLILATIQFISYSALFVKPIFAIVSDNYSINNRKRKPYIIISGVFLALSFIVFTLNFTELIIFCVFLTINFAASSLMDVAVKGLIIDTSSSIKSKNRKIFLTKIGAGIGAMYPSITFLLFMDDIYSIESWSLFLSLSYIFLIPLLFLLFITKETKNNPNNINIPSENYQKSEQTVFINNSSFKVSFLSMCLFTFLLYGDKLFEYPLEPWIIEKFGENNFYLFSFFLIIGVFMNILGFVIGTFFIKNFNRKNILTILTIFCGIIEILFGFVDFFTFLILLGLIQIFAGIISMNLISLIMDFAKNNKVIYYQIIVSFFSLAVIIFVPLGTLLSNYIATEMIFIISGIILLSSIVPLSRIKLINDKD